eukprot:TRINITY_DN2269_c0_g1_i1.p1 TRINITY_DN2269_c0_g1~~TRINITY_DN2269_c0_g1_i1.p1  ORF type:complete len:914 (+),score=128.61 TRINITY_DN2269_c0_g1_i1:84-2825(+)
MWTLRAALLWLAVVVVVVGNADRTTLRRWHMRQEADGDDGAAISAPGFAAGDDWFSVTVPATVIAGLLQNDFWGKDFDPFFGTNFETLVADSALFDPPWWFRADDFHVSCAAGEQALRLVLDGLSYRANVWVNGVQVGELEEVGGALRVFEFDISGITCTGGQQAVSVAVEIFRAGSLDVYDLGVYFIDWAPHPPDSSMGLWQDVSVMTTGPVSVAYPSVSSALDTSADGTVMSACLTVLLEVANHADTAVDGTVSAEVVGVATVSRDLLLEPLQITQVTFDCASNPSLVVQSPLLWWPWDMGQPSLYTLKAAFTLRSGTVSDSLLEPFGIRTVTCDLDSRGNRLFRINGEPVLVRGAGWTPDLFLRPSTSRKFQELTYVRDMGLNTLRMEGKFEDPAFYTLADRMGIMVISGWSCCDAWQSWNDWSDDQMHIAEESTRSQAKRLRIHPSVVVFMYASDEIPPEHVEQMYLRVLSEEQWPNPSLASAANRTSTITGASGVKMTGPYSWVPPIYWVTDGGQWGGAWGFLTEGGPGENPLEFPSLNRTLPEDDLWPIGDAWNYHCGYSPPERFGNLDRFNEALYARYGRAAASRDYAVRAQVAVYESVRAMFESYNRNKFVSTGVIFWMLNNAWPEMIWHLYDYYFTPSASYFAVKRSNEPLHVQYGYDDHYAWIVPNSRNVTVGGRLSIVAAMYDTAGRRLFSGTYTVAPAVELNVPIKVAPLPAFRPRNHVYFLRLVLQDEHQAVVSSNFYWLSSEPDVLNWEESYWLYTPCSEYADYTGLMDLPRVTLQSTFAAAGNRTDTVSNATVYVTKVTVTNVSPQVIAFFVRLRLLDRYTGEEVLPVVWDDNFITLLPRERRTLYATTGVRIKHPRVSAEPWNNVVQRSTSHAVTPGWLAAVAPVLLLCFSLLTHVM